MPENLGQAAVENLSSAPQPQLFNYLAQNANSDNLAKVLNGLANTPTVALKFAAAIEQFTPANVT